MPTSKKRKKDKKNVITEIKWAGLMGETSYKRGDKYDSSSLTI